MALLGQSQTFYCALAQRTEKGPVQVDYKRFRFTGRDLEGFLRLPFLAGAFFEDTVVSNVAVRRYFQIYIGARLQREYKILAFRDLRRDLDRGFRRNNLFLYFRPGFEECYRLLSREYDQLYT